MRYITGVNITKIQLVVYVNVIWYVMILHSVWLIHSTCMHVYSCNALPCRSSNNTDNSNAWDYRYSGIYGPFDYPNLVHAILFLVMTVCFIKRHTARENGVTENFYVFVTIGQVFNSCGQIFCAALLLIPPRHSSVIITLLIAIFN